MNAGLCVPGILRDIWEKVAFILNFWSRNCSTSFWICGEYSPMKTRNQSHSCRCASFIYVPISWNESNNPVKEWYRKVGYPSAEKYYKISESVDSFKSCNSSLGIHLRYMELRFYVNYVSRHIGEGAPSLSRAFYTNAFLDEFTATSSDMLLKTNSELLRARSDYKNRAEVVQKDDGFVIQNS